MFNRQSVQTAIKATQQRLKRHTRCPKNGLVVFSGLAIADQTDGKMRQMTVDFEPCHPVQKFIYRCDKRFHTEQLAKLLSEEGEDPFGFIVVDGNGALFGVVRGSSREVLRHWSVTLPNKHGRGGQSANRFERLRLQKRHDYLRSVAEQASQLFLGSCRPIVKGIVVAGSAGFKHELLKSNRFDRRLSKVVVASIDVAYGGDRGFCQAIEQSAEAIGSRKLLQEKRVLRTFMEEISRNNGRYCCSLRDTLEAMEMGAIQELILWEELEVNRYELRNNQTGKETVLYLTADEEKAEGREDFFQDSETGLPLNIKAKLPLVQWISEVHQNFGCNLQLVSDQSGLGNQFVKGFGGIGGTLRWKVDTAEEESCPAEDENDSAELDLFWNEDEDGGYGFDDGDFGF